MLRSSCSVKLSHYRSVSTEVKRIQQYVFIDKFTSSVRSFGIGTGAFWNSKLNSNASGLLQNSSLSPAECGFCTLPLANLEQPNAFSSGADETSSQQTVNCLDQTFPNEEILKPRPALHTKPVLQSPQSGHFCSKSIDSRVKWQEFIPFPEWDFTYHGDQALLQSSLETGIMLASGSGSPELVMSLLRFCREKYIVSADKCSPLPYSLKQTAFNIAIETCVLSGLTHSVVLEYLTEIFDTMKIMKCPADCVTLYDLLYFTGSLNAGSLSLKPDHVIKDQLGAAVANMVRCFVADGFVSTVNTLKADNVESSPNLVNDIFKHILIAKREQQRCVLSSNALSDDPVVEQLKTVFPDIDVSQIVIPGNSGFQHSSLVSELISAPVQNSTYPRFLDELNIDIRKCAEEQRSIEQSGGLEVNGFLAMGVHKYGPLLQYIVDLCHKQLDKNFRQFQDDLRANCTNSFLLALFTSLPPDVYVDAMRKELGNWLSCGTFYLNDFNTPGICHSLGDRLFSVANIRLSQIDKAYDEYLEYFNDESLVKTYNHRQYFLECLRRVNNNSDPNLDRLLPNKGLLKFIGEPLFELFLKSNRVPSDLHRAQKLLEAQNYEALNAMESIPMFYKASTVINGKNLSFVASSNNFVKLFRYSDWRTTRITYDRLPMLVPPRPRINADNGGYLTVNAKYFTGPASDVTEHLLCGLPQGQLDPFVDAQNQLTATPWKVNQPILDFMLTMFSFMDLRGTENIIIKKQEAAREATRKFRLLSIANEFRNKVFWFNVGSDFRGRVSALSFFSHMDADFARGLLLFAKGRPLGPRKPNVLSELEFSGFDWLKIHAVNQTDLCKNSSLQDRLEVAESPEIMEKILASARNPREEKWWTEQKNPWQLLATCMEIANVLNCDNPVDYICHLPIHQDGSCNGLQHFAALTRDQFIGSKVNLTPHSVPADFYGDIALQAEAKRKELAEAGNLAAQNAQGLVTRSTVKELLLTIEYGSKPRKVELMIDREGDHLKAVVFMVSESQLWRIHQAQRWLREVSSLWLKEFNQPMQWTTPLGLLVYAPYKTLASNMAGQTTESIAVSNQIGLDKRITNLGTSTGFVHSLEVTHLLLTFLASRNEGFTMAAVHDSYWTHPCDVGLMNKATREQFYRLYSVDQFEITAKELRTLAEKESGKLKSSRPSRLLGKLETLPSKGKLDLSQVKNSVYFFA